MCNALTVVRWPVSLRSDGQSGVCSDFPGGRFSRSVMLGCGAREWNNVRESTCKETRGKYRGNCIYWETIGQSCHWQSIDFGRRKIDSHFRVCSMRNYPMTTVIDSWTNLTNLYLSLTCIARTMHPSSPSPAASLVPLTHISEEKRSRRLCLHSFFIVALSTRVGPRAQVVNGQLTAYTTYRLKSKPQYSSTIH